MAQNTTSSAYSQLQPNKSNNIGNIVQENIRYWRKYEDEKTAREKIQKAREAEFKYKQDQNADALFEALRPDDPIGVFNSKLAEAFEKNQDKLLDLSIKASKGDTSAKIQYQKELTKWSNLASAGSAFQNKIKANAEARKNGLYNPILDESFINFEKSLINGALTFNPDTLETTITSADGTDIVLPASKITSNEFFTHQYSPPAKFQEYGTALTESIYGQNPNISDEDAMLKGRKQVRNIFATDPIERDSWYGTYLKRQGINPRGQKSYDELDLNQKIAIEDAYIAENVQRPIKTTKEKLEEAKLEGAIISNQESRVDKKIKDEKLKLLKNPPEKEDKSTEASKKRNYTRTLVDGIMAGDLSSIQTLVDLQPSSSKKGYISDVDYANGILEYKFTEKEGGEKGEDKEEILRIDTSKPDAPSKILALLYPTSDPANSMYNYKFGKPLETFEKSESKTISKFVEEKIREGIVVNNESKTVKKLKELGIELKQVNIGTDAVEYKGIEYSLESDEDKEKLVNKILEDKKGQSKSKGKEIKLSDIPSKASASGYSVSEYTKLLKQNGVKIIE